MSFVTALHTSPLARLGIWLIGVSFVLFQFFLQLSSGVAFVATVIGMILMGALVEKHGWRGFINSAGIVGLVIAFLCLKFIPNSPPKTQPSQHYGQQLLQYV